MKSILPSFLLALLVGCGTGDSSSSTDTRTEDSQSDSFTIEYKLATIHGDPSTEDEFRAILDRMQAGVGHCNPEPDRQRAADTLVASWQQSGKQESLLAWAQALLGACG